MKKIWKKIKKIFLYCIIFVKYKRMKNVKISKQRRIENNFELDINKNSNVEIGENLKVKKNVSIRCRENAYLHIGDRVYFNNNCIITCRKNIFIGNDVSFGPNAIIFDHDHDYKSKSRKDTFVCDQIKIGNNVWVGANACILKGSDVGDNAVIAAGAIVNSKVPANSVYYSKNKIRNIN